jgi:hypothetical protein
MIGAETIAAETSVEATTGNHSPGELAARPKSC